MRPQKKPKNPQSHPPPESPSPDLIAEKLSQIQLQEIDIEKWLQKFHSLSKERKEIPDILQCADLFAFPPSHRKPVKVKKRMNNHDFMAPSLEISDFVAIDCEMVGCARSQALARVAAVNEDGYVIYDAFVEPEAPVTDWRTKWSGVSPKILADARKRGEVVTYTQAQFDLQGILNGRTVVGHAIKNDLTVLDLDHPFYRTIDTQKLPRFGSSGNGLKTLMQRLYGIAIQSKKGHSPVEDARAAMLLFRTFRTEFEQMQRSLASGEQSLRGVTVIKHLPIDQPYPLADKRGHALVMKPKEIHLNTIVGMGVLVDA